MRKHFVIPDLQVKPGVPLNHCEWIGKLIVEEKPDVVINLGDHCDVTSLSSYDRGKLSFEGRRFRNDILAAEEANKLLLTPLYDQKWAFECETHMLIGNHENRIERFAEENPELAGFLTVESLGYDQWYDYVHQFLEPKRLDGVSYAHYFYNPLSGRPWGGQIATRQKNIGMSFTMGHQQGVGYSMRTLADGSRQHGLVAGSCYLHDEGYLGPQADHHWNGVVIKDHVREGDYDLRLVSLETLCMKYEHMTLQEFLSDKSLWYVSPEV